MPAPCRPHSSPMPPSHLGNAPFPPAPLSASDCERTAVEARCGRQEERVIGIFREGGEWLSMCGVGRECRGVVNMCGVGRECRGDNSVVCKGDSGVCAGVTVCRCDWCVCRGDILPYLNITTTCSIIASDKERKKSYVKQWAHV